MNQASTPHLQTIQAEALAFRNQFSSLLLASADESGLPHASYGVYILDESGRYYLYLSELAQHTRNLCVNPKASVLFIEDETHTDNLFARRRLSCQCRVERIDRNSTLWNEIISLFMAQRGSTMEMLKGLTDFHLFCLIPETATYVKGFAKAYQLDGEHLQDIRHKNDQGHR